MYKCPECENRKPFATLGGWKRHMTSTHQGYTPSDLAEASGSAEGTHVTGASSFEEFTAGLPETESGFRITEAPDVEQEDTEREDKASEKERKQANKRIRARMDSIKQKLSKDAPEQAFKAAGLELEPSESEWISEAIETVFDILGVEFDVQPYAVTVTNRFVILLYPILVIAVVLGNKLFKQYQAEQEKKRDNIIDMPAFMRKDEQ